MAELLDVDVRTVSKHLGNVFSSGELERQATIRRFRVVRTTGTRQATRSIDHYNLDAIISVDYRVNSVWADQSRQCATVQNKLHYAVHSQTAPTSSTPALMPTSPTWAWPPGPAAPTARTTSPVKSWRTWADLVNAFLDLDDRQVLESAGSISKSQVDDHTLSEF